MGWLDTVIQATRHLNNRLSWADFDSFIPKFDEIHAAYLTAINPQLKITSFGDRGMLYSRKESERAGARERYKLPYLLEDVIPLAFKITYVNTCSDTDIWSHPCKEGIVSNEVWEKAVNRSRIESLVGHFCTLPESIYVFRCATGFDPNNPFIRMMKYYLQVELKGVEPFVPGRLGAFLTNIKGDNMAATRLLLLLNAAMFWHQFKDSFRDGFFEEVVEFLFQDPHYHSKVLKDTINVTRKGAFCSAPLNKGWIINWNPIGEGWDVSLNGYALRAVDFNDPVYAAYIKEDVNKCLKDLSTGVEAKFDKDKKFIPMSMFRLGVELLSMLEAEVNEANIRKWGVLLSLEGMTGYTRTLAPLSHKKQVEIEHVPENELTWSVIPFLEDEWCKLVIQCARARKIMSYHEWEWLLHSIQTTRSAGGDAISMKVPVKFNLPAMGRLKEDKDGGKVLAMLFTDKSMCWLANPAKYKNPQVFMQMYDEITPGQVGNRYVVGGKAARAVFMIRESDYCHEAALAIGANDEMARSVETTQPWGTMNDFREGKDTGIIPIDHTVGLYYTSTGRHMIVAADQSNFDSHQGPKIRLAGVNGTKRALLMEGLTGKWGPWNSFFTMWEILQGPGKKIGAVYKSGSGEYEQTITMSSEQSGELLTLVNNNLVNRSLFRVFWEKFTVSALERELRLKVCGFLGDDSIQIYEMMNPKHWSLSRYELFLDMNVMASRENDFEQHKKKSESRLSSYEFLKKRCIYGYQASIFLTQLFASENAPNRQWPTTMVSSYARTCSLMWTRGFDHDLMVRIVWYTWMMHRTLKMIDGHETKYYVLPMALLFTPISMRGCGQLPWTLMGASKDVIIALSAQKDPVMAKYINSAAGVVAKVSTSNIRQTMADLITQGDGIFVAVRGSKEYKEMPPVLNGIRDLQQRMQDPRIVGRIDAARQAAKFLDRYGIHSERLYYENFPFQKVKQSVEANPKLAELDAAQRLNSGGKYVVAAKGKYRGDIVRDYAWACGFDFTLGDVVPYAIDARAQPFAGLKDYSRDVICRTGILKGKDAFEMRPNMFLNILRRDKYFRRDIQPETLFEFLTQPKMAQNQELMYNALIYIGADPDLAQQVVQQLIQQGKMFQFRANAKSFSLNDDFLSLCDLSVEGHRRLVDIPNIPDGSIVQLFYEIGYMFAISEGFRTREPIRQVRVGITPEGLIKCAEQLTGSKTSYVTDVWLSTLFSRGS
jgi:hypothetical protein